MTLLHYIVITDRCFDKDKYNEYGLVIAEQLLIQEDFPKEKIQFIKRNTLNHSIKKELQKKIV